MPWDIALIFLFLAVVIPWRGTVRLRKLLDGPPVGSRERIALYLSTIGFQWLLALVVAWRAWARGYSLEEMGIGVKQPLGLLAAAALGAFLFGALQWVNLRRAGLTGSTPSSLRRIAEKILPRTPAETVPYVGLAVTAGICEEFLYRGFAMASLARAGAGSVVVVVVTAVLFGFAHLYQGRSGLVGTSAMGLILGAARLLLGSLVPLVIWHAAIDVVAGIAGRYLLTGDRI